MNITRKHWTLWNGTQTETIGVLKTKDGYIRKRPADKIIDLLRRLPGVTVDEQ